MKEFTVNQRVRIIRCLHGHGFEIGEIVIIKSVEDYEDSYGASNGKDLWWIGSDEAEEVMEIEESKPIEGSIFDLMDKQTKNM